MHIKLFLLTMLLSCGVVLGMKKNLEDKQLYSHPFSGDCAPKVINQLSLQGLGRLGCADRFLSKKIDSLIDGIFLGTLLLEYAQLGLLKQDNVICQKALCGYAEKLYGISRDDYTENEKIKRRIFEQLYDSNNCIGQLLRMSVGNLWRNRILLCAGHPAEINIYDQVKSVYFQQKETYGYYESAVMDGVFILAENIVRKNKFDQLKSNDIDFCKLSVKGGEKSLLTFLASVGYNKVDMSRHTALYTPYIHNFSYLTQMLLENKVDFDSQLLTLVCKHHDQGMLKWFLKNGGDVNTQLLGICGREHDHWYDGDDCESDCRTLLEHMRAHPDKYAEILQNHIPFHKDYRRSIMAAIILSSYLIDNQYVTPEKVVLTSAIINSLSYTYVNATSLIEFIAHVLFYYCVLRGR